MNALLKDNGVQRGGMFGESSCIHILACYVNHSEF